MRKVVIIGGSYAGLLAAEVIYKYGGQNVKITLVSTSSKAFFNVASPRILIEPELIDKAFFSVEKGLRKRANGAPYEFIHGLVLSTQFEQKKVIIKTGEEEKVLSYDGLIIASGASTDNNSFKLNGNYDHSINALKELHKDIVEAKHICVIGGGPTGVETASEIGFAYGETKKVVLYTGSSDPLSYLGHKASAKALDQLRENKVEVIKGLKIDSFNKVGNKFCVKTINRKPVDFDLVIPALGVKPNSSFIDKEFLDSNGFLETDDHLCVKGFPEVLGFGDILALSGDRTIVDIKMRQLSVLEASVRREILNDSTAMMKNYIPGKPTVFIPISKNGGVGMVFGWNIPSFIVRMLKSKDFMLSKAEESF